MAGYGYLLQSCPQKFYVKVRVWELAKIKGIPNRCAFCGSTENLTIDHKLPKSKYKKARGLLANYQLLCYNCNMLKGNKIILKK